MGRDANPKQLLESWLEANKERFAERFDASPVNDWDEWEQHGIALDFFGPKVCGRITVWAQHHMVEGHAVADFEALVTDTGTILFSWAYAKFSPELIDRWFEALRRLADGETTEADPDKVPQ